MSGTGGPGRPLSAQWQKDAPYTPRGLTFSDEGPLRTLDVASKSSPTVRWTGP